MTQHRPQLERSRKPPGLVLTLLTVLAASSVAQASGAQEEATGAQDLALQTAQEQAERALVTEIEQATDPALQEGQEDGRPEGEQEGDDQRPRGSLPGVPGEMTDQEEAALRLVDEILREQQVLLTGQNFVYQAGGRRDPFRSLLQLRQRELAAPELRPAGLPGFLITEIDLRAVARYQGRWHVMIVGLDQRTYFADVGTQLYDGRIVEINDEEVVFEQEVEDLLGARSSRRVIKRLNPGTEE